MDTYKKKELLIGALMLGAGLLYLFLTVSLPRKGFIDASTVPYVLAAGLCLLGILQLVHGSKVKPPVADATSEDDADAIDYPTVIKTLGLIGIYMALLEPVGFVIMTVLYLYLQFIVLTPREQKVHHLTYAVIALVSSALIFATFRQGFDLMLPAGLLSF
ncbi:tripartite tricarboxylate transporter TctB family protein [Pseudomonas sp. CrR25]|nr:tripartite tricarboxylate transporter TctB family protein [Pseudomonas sp. CrR25]